MLKVAAVAAAFVVGLLAARFLTYWAAYHTRPAVVAEGAAVCRAMVDRVAGKPGQAQIAVTVTSGPYSGQKLRATHAFQGAQEHDAVRAGEEWLVGVRSLDGRLTAHLLSRERDGYLIALTAALAALLAVTAGRKGVATLGSVAWALALLVGLMLPAVSIGAPAATWSVPLALAIAAPTLIAIGGFNRKSIAALGGTLCGLVAGGLLAVGLAEAMALTGLEAEFGPYHHLDNILWFAEPLRGVRFGSLLVAGMLLAGLGAVMDVSMAVASTVAEVHRIAPLERRWCLFRSGLAAGRDIFGAMVFTLTLVFVGSHLIFFVSVGPAWQADRWLRLANYEQTASELARVAAAAVGMALSVPATALLAAMFYGNRTSPEGERAPRPPVRLASIVRPFLAAMVCLAAAGLADELMLRGYQGSPGQRESETVARVVASDEPVVELDAESAGPHEKTFFRSQVAVIQPCFGPRAGELLTSRLLLGPNPSHNLVLQRNAVIHVSVEETVAGVDVQFYKPPLRYRWGLIAFVITAATVIVTGGRGGVRMLAVMLAAAVLMIGVLIPLLAEGCSPLLTTGVFCVVMLLAVLAVAAIVAAVTAGGASWWHLREDRSLRATLPALPSDTADLLERAVQARQSQRAGEALLALWTARERSPQDPRVRIELAYIYMTQRYVVQARREIEAAFAMGADDSVAHYVAGVVYAWTDQGEKAERHLRRAVTLDPNNNSAREALERLFGR